MTNRLEDFPRSVQCLLKEAAWHLQELDTLEAEFRAWQEAQAVQPAPCVETLLLLGTPSKAEQARLRWEAQVRAVVRGAQ